MNAFSSPLESFAFFDYFISDVSTIFVSNIWTWLAVFCAGAASFIWRAKADPVTFQLASPEPEPEGQVAPLIQTSSVTAQSESNLHKVASSDPAGYEREKHMTVLESGDGVMRGKFVAYYYYPEEESENVFDDEKCDGDEHAEMLRLFKVDRLERMREMNEDGLYPCQDLSVLCGDIVRLWDARFM